MTFQNGDLVKFKFEGKMLEGKLVGKNSEEWLVQYTGIFPKGFRDSNFVSITQSDMALKDGDIFVNDGDIAMTGQATIRCKFDDIQAQNE